MNELLVGYARVSTEQQDLTAQRNGLHAVGVGDDRICVDHGLTGTNRDRPGLRLALAACRAGDTLVVTKLDRLARSLPHARNILDELTKCNVKLSLGGSNPRSDGSRRTTVVQRAGDGGGVRIRPDPTAHQRRNERSQGQGPAARKATEAQAEPGKSTYWSCTTLRATPKLSSPNSSGSDDPPCTGPSSGCDPGHQNRSGHSHISRIPHGSAAHAPEG